MDQKTIVVVNWMAFILMVPAQFSWPGRWLVKIVEVSMLANVEPRTGFYRYLKAIVDAGYDERVMFGSDQMVWPGIIEPAIDAIEKAPFLTRRQKRDIFYNNAARFLRFSPEEIARHRRM